MSTCHGLSELEHGKVHLTGSVQGRGAVQGAGALQWGATRIFVEIYGALPRRTRRAQGCQFVSGILFKFLFDIDIYNLISFIFISFIFKKK